MSNFELKLDNTAVGYPETLLKIYDIKNVVGKDNCFLSITDVIFLYGLILSKKPKRVLELVRYCGFGTLVMAGALIDSGANGKMVSVDHLNADRQALDQVKDIVKDTVTFIDSTTLWPEEISNQKFDLAFIDGNYTRDEMIQHFNNFLKLSNPVAYLMFHNISPSNIMSIMREVSANNLHYSGTFGDKITLIVKETR
jgi:predicted O-methyltransferase YrrM